MGLCLRKLFTSPEDEEDDRTTAIVVPVAEVSRIAAWATALVITHSHFKFSAIAVGGNKSNSTIPTTLEYGEDFLSYQVKTVGFQYDCKPFTWHFPELYHNVFFC